MLQISDPIYSIPKKICSDNSIFNYLSQNVLFASVTFKDGKKIIGSACYVPVLETFIKNKNKYSMSYQSVLGGASELIVSYNTEKDSYFGKKFVNGQEAGSAVGKEWKSFFHHFTSLGISDGELCEIKCIS